MSMGRKAFVCIHGFGTDPGVSGPGFSHALRDNVRNALRQDIVWEEVVWSDLLESPPTESLVEFARHVPEIVRKFYRGAPGQAIMARVSEAVGVAFEKADGLPVVLVGHSFGGAIAYEAIARRKATKAKGLVMLAPPMGIFNNPQSFVRSVKSHGIACRGLATALRQRTLGSRAVGFPKVKGGRLQSVSALAIRGEGDLFAEPLTKKFFDVDDMTVTPPPDACGSGKHMFYWRSRKVAESVAGIAARLVARTI